MKRLVVGLGNPGKPYERTRHNAGFLAIDEIASRDFFPPFSLQKTCRALISARKSGESHMILAKPQTYMNSSGKAVKSLLRFFSLSIEDLLVIHDDIDIPLGILRHAEGRGSAGHRGVESVIRELGTKDFARLRVGILPETGKPANTDAFVLKPFSGAELEILQHTFAHALPPA